MTVTFWAEAGVLYAAAVLGVLAVAPYALRLIEGSDRPVKVSPRTLLLASLVQSAVLFAVVVPSGLFIAHAVGFGAPLLEAALSGRPGPPLAAILSWGAALGVGSGLVLTAADLVLLPRMPPKLIETARRTSLAENVAASFYGGLNEELLTRWLGLSAIVWLWGQVSRPSAGGHSEAALWTANIVMAVLFGLGHLPAARALVGKITPLLLARTLALNAPVALACGWLFWRFGLEAAVLAHFAADIVYHVGGTALLRANDRLGFMPWFPRPPTSTGFPPEGPLLGG
jgi:hypothetical protein